MGFLSKHKKRKKQDKPKSEYFEDLLFQLFLFREIAPGSLLFSPLAQLVSNLVFTAIDAVKLDVILAVLDVSSIRSSCFFFLLFSFSSSDRYCHFFSFVFLFFSFHFLFGIVFNDLFLVSQFLPSFLLRYLLFGLFS